MNQILTHMANRCDRSWEGFQTRNKVTVKREITWKASFADRDMASFFGDFAFTVLPKITPEAPLEDKELDLAVEQLQKLDLEIGGCDFGMRTDERFLIRFLSEKFN